MRTPRRFLPSTNLLLAFETAARCQSFTRAAQELDLTQSAVSRQIRALEDQIGVALFIRERQRVVLSAAGARYVEEVREALARIAKASMLVAVNPGGGTLDLAVLPTLATRWLAPRLADFLARNPGVGVNFSTRIKPFDFSVEPFDAAIHFGPPDWPGCAAAFLMHETVIPACSPDFAASHDLCHPDALAEVPLIHLASRPEAWAQWFAANGCAHTPAAGMVFDQFATAAQAAHHGLGVALLPAFLIRRELAEGALVAAIDAPMQSAQSYHLVWPKARATYPPLDAFREWLLAVARRESTGAPTA